MNLQERINLANPGDTITIPDGDVSTGNFTINKPLNIIGGPGTKIVSPTFDPTIKIPPGTGPVVLQGLEITCAESMARMSVLVEYGSGGPDQNTLDKVPKGLTIDKCDIHAYPHTDIQRGVAANGANFRITNSKVREIHGVGYDTQAVCVWNGPGPFTLLDCYFEGAGENVMFGGAIPSIPGLIHSDIEVRRCYFFKPRSWYSSDPSYAGIEWTVKNLFELKNARRVIVEGNVFENNWTQAQAGRAIVFTPRPSDSGTAALIEDVLFQHNIIKNVGSGILLLGIDDPPQPQDVRLKRVKVLNNLWIVDGPVNGSNGVFATVVNGTEDVTFENNTAFQTGSLILTDYLPNQRFVFINNIGRHNDYGIFGSGSGVGNLSIAKYFPSSFIGGNIIAKEVSGPDSPSEFESRYPAGNYFPNTLAEVVGVDYRLLSAWKGKGVDAKDSGVDIDALMAAQGGTGVPTPIPTPVPTPTPTPIPPAVPTVTLTSPSNGAVLSGKITVTATITNTTGIGDVYLLAGEAIMGLKSAPSYEFSLDTTKLPDGEHSLWVRAWHETGKAYDSDQVTVTVKNSIVQPPPPPPPTIPCSISAPVSVSILRNGTGMVDIELLNLTAATEVRVIVPDGQVTVSPTSWSANPNDRKKQFNVRVKKQSREIKFSSGCGVAVVRVNVT